MDTGVSRLLATVRTPTILANWTDVIQKHANYLESAIATLGNELSYHSETLLHQVRLHGQELSHVMVNRYFYRPDPAQFIFAQDQANGQWNELIGGMSTLHLVCRSSSLVHRRR